MLLRNAETSLSPSISSPLVKFKYSKYDLMYGASSSTKSVSI